MKKPEWLFPERQGLGSVSSPKDWLYPEIQSPHPLEVSPREGLDMIISRIGQDGSVSAPGEDLVRPEPLDISSLSYKEQLELIHFFGNKLFGFLTSPPHLKENVTHQARIATSFAQIKHDREFVEAIVRYVEDMTQSHYNPPWHR